MNTVLIWILTVLCALLLAFNIFYAVQRILKSRMFRARKQARQEERARAQDKKENDAELSEEVLAVLISAAVSTLYSQKKNARFRVVSFGRIGKNKNESSERF